MTEEFWKQRREEIERAWLICGDVKSLTNELISQEQSMLDKAKAEAREEFAREIINKVELKKVWTDKMLLSPALVEDFWNKALEITIEIINELLRGDK